MDSLQILNASAQSFVDHVGPLGLLVILPSLVGSLRNEDFDELRRELGIEDSLNLDKAFTYQSSCMVERWRDECIKHGESRPQNFGSRLDE